MPDTRNSRPRHVTSPRQWVLWLLLCTVLLPGRSGAQTTPGVSRELTAPTSWPQVANIEAKSPRPDESTTTAPAGMPVPDPRQADYDVLHYTLDLQVEPTWGWIAGKVGIIFQAQETPLSELVLDLKDGMVCSAATARYPYLINLAYTQANDQLVIDLPSPMDPGSIGFVEVQYYGQPQPDGLFGYQLNPTAAGDPTIATVSEPWSARSWWPCKDEPTDKATVNMNVTVWDGLTAVSNGQLIEQDGPTWRWNEPEPISTYLVSLAVAPYVEIKDQYDGPAGKIDLRHYVFAEDEAAAREDLSILPEMLDFCGDLFGPYPFAGQPLGIAECVWDQAMEHPTAITYGNVLLPGTHQFDTVLVHELSHMWFGDMVTPTDWTQIWLNEGFATYTEALWAEHVYGPTGLKNFMASHNWGHDYGTGAIIRDPGVSWTGYYFKPIVYHTAAWVLHMLRHWMGDENFFAALRHYLDNPDLRFGNADSADFQQACEDILGYDMSWFFDQWLNRTTYPVLSLDFNDNWIAGTNYFHIRLSQEQIAEPDGSREPFLFLVDLRLVGAGLDTTITTASQSLVQDYTFLLKKKVTQVYVDPDRWLLHEMVANKSGPDSPAATAPVTLLPAYPNPFNPRTLFRWEATTETRDLVEVFDVQGRRVLREDLGVKPAGPREFLWLGNDNAGRQYPSGIYLYRITSQGSAADGPFRQQLQGKVTLTR